MTEERQAGGQLHISDDILAELAGFAALESYGVVGMANPSLAAGAARLLHPGKLKKGVKIVNDSGKVRVELHVVLEYGTNLNEVARNLSDRVTYEIKRHAGIKVAFVEIYIQDLKVK